MIESNYEVVARFGQVCSFILLDGDNVFMFLGRKAFLSPVIAIVGLKKNLPVIIVAPLLFG